MGNLLSRPEIEGNQAENYLTSNEADEVLDLALTGMLLKTVTASDVTLTDLEHDECMVIRTSGVMTGTKNLIVKSRAKLFLIDNTCTGGFNLTIKTAAGTGVAVANATKTILFCDGVNVIGPW